MKEIILTQGKVALVDDEDYEKVSQYKWHAQKGHNTFYAVRSVWKSNKIQMHKFIMNANFIDHKDGSGLNNQKENLRVCNNTENSRNCKLTYNSTTGYKGVHWDKNNKKYQVEIMVNRKHIFLGRFVDIIEAAKAYDKAALKYFGEFARLNFPK